MGVIRDGTVSGVIPSAEAFVVHYPGYPSSFSCAIRTLGGSDAILKVHASHSEKLELHFRPEDPYSHPAFGSLHPCTNLLLKISRRELCDGNGSDHTSEINTDLSADIVSRVSEAYHFSGMVDYQYIVAVHAVHGKRKEEMESESGKDSSSVLGVEDENMMMLVPPLFSLKDAPERTVLRCGAVSSKKKQEGIVQQRWEMDIEPCLALDFGIREIPKKVNWEDYIEEGCDEWRSQMSVSRLFDERPVWPKYSLKHRLFSDTTFVEGEYALRRLLFRVAYYFSNGPFLRFWIRKGYDPRQDSQSRIYQTVDFRVPVPLRRRRCDVDADTKKGNQRWAELCEFKVFPNKHQISLQLCEAVDDYIRDVIHKPIARTTCSYATGWFSYGVLDSLRLRVAVRFLSVSPHPDARGMLHFASARFERSKKIFFNKHDLKPDAFQPVPLSIQGGDEDGDEDVDDDDDDDGDDDMSDGDEGDGEYPISTCDHAREDGVDDDVDDVSRAYLQDLFGGFPPLVAGDEYAIYEQDSSDVQDPHDDDDDDDD